MTTKTDLFPETLLVDFTDGHIFTTSLKVAEHFHKNHQHVLRDIEKVIVDAAELGISLSNFGLSDYKNSRG
jgi:phage regulator Rha-like protein